MSELYPKYFSWKLKNRPTLVLEQDAETDIFWMFSGVPFIDESGREFKEMTLSGDFIEVSREEAERIVGL